MTKRCEVEIAFERALEQIQARVSVLTGEKQHRIAVAYSGGLDSSVLLHLACRHTQSHALQIHAFHVHHGLSPNADDWLAHCRCEAKRMGASFGAAKVQIDASSIAEQGVEQAARTERYAVLNELCAESGIRLLLTAHHQDDQAETIMLQLMRGSGLPGLSGMVLLHEGHALLGKSLSLGRPFLEVSRAALEGYAARHSLPYVTDESNQAVAYRRNAMRNVAFPLLEVNFPGFTSCVARSARHVQSAQLLLQELAVQDMHACRETQSETALRLAELRKLSPRRCANLLRHWLAELGMPMPSTARLEQLQLQLLGAGQDRQPVWEFGSFCLSREENCLVARPNMGLPPEHEALLSWKGEPEIAIPQWHGALVFERSASGISEGSLRGTPLAIRARRGQERLKISQNRPSRTLKNLFQEAAIPAWQRDWLPLAFLEQKLIFVAGLGMDARHCANGAGIRLNWRPDWQNTR